MKIITSTMMMNLLLITLFARPQERKAIQAENSFVARIEAGSLFHPSCSCQAGQVARLAVRPTNRHLLTAFCFFGNC